MTSDPIVPPELPPPPPPSSGSPTQDERQWGMFAHLSSLLGFLACGLSFIAPLIIWLMKKDTSAYVDHHGKESLNFQITMVIATVVVLVIGLLTCGIGLFIAPVVTLVDIIFTIIAGIKANEGVLYRYPVSIRFIH